MIRPFSKCERLRCSMPFNEHSADDQRCPDGQGYFRKTENFGRCSGSFNDREISALNEILRCVAEGRSALHVVSSPDFDTLAVRIAKMTSRAKSTADLRDPNRGEAQRRVLAVLRAHPDGIDRGAVVRAVPDHAGSVDSSLVALLRKGLAQRVRRGRWKAIEIADVVAIRRNETKSAEVAAHGEVSR